MPRIVLLVLLTGLCCVCSLAAAVSDEEAKPSSMDGGTASPWKTWTYDFEPEIKVQVDPDKKVYEIQPSGWEKIVTKAKSQDYNLGHPFYNKGEILPEDGGKNWFLQMVLESGKVSYQTSTYSGARDDEHFIPINAAKSYHLSAKIKASGFEQPFRPTGAYVSILWFEKPDDEAICRYADGAPIIFRTTPVTRNSAEKWQEVGLTADTVPPGAKFVKIRCTLEGKGIRAVAKFDDIILSEGPRVTIAAARRVPLFLAGEEMRVTFLLDGLEKGRYMEEALTEDIYNNRTLSRDTNQFDVGLQPERPGKLGRPYVLQVAAFGVFRLTYILKDASGREIAVRSMVLARAPQTGALKRPDNLGVLFDFFQHPFVGNYISSLGVGVMKSELWGNPLTQEKDQQDLLRFAGEVRRAGVKTIGVLGVSPAGLTKSMGLSAPLEGKALFDQPPGERREALWGFLKEDLAPWADLLEGVQLARDGDGSFTGSVKDIVANFAQRMSLPLGSARCAVPAMATSTDAPPEGVDVLALKAPATMSPDDLSRKLEATGRSSSLWMTLDLRPPGTEQIQDMLKKITVCLAGRVDKIFLPLDLPDAGLIRIMEYPNEAVEITPAFAAFRFFTQMLDGAAFVEKFSMGTVQMYLFEKEGESLAVVWNEGPEISVPVFWGERLKMYDHFGNRLEARSAGGETLIEKLGQTPRIVTGMNPNMMRMWRSLKLVTKSIEASVKEQTVELSMENHFSKNIEFTVRLELEGEAQHLQSLPATAKFSLAPGAAWSSGESFHLKPSISDTVGIKTFRAVVTVNSDEGTFTLKKTMGVELAPSQIELRLVRISTEDDGVIAIRAAVKNNAAERVGVNIYAAADDGAGPERHVCLPRLEPGKEAEIEFRIKTQGGIPPSRLWLGLREINGRRFVNINLAREQIEASLNK